MSNDLLRHVLENREAAQQATREARLVTAQAESESRATIRALDARPGVVVVRRGDSQAKKGGA
jgi:hypothetical protein